MANKLSTRYWSDSECQPRWAEAIGSAYFPLSLEFAPSTRFSGSLQIWETNSTSLTLSRLRSSQLGYSRSKAQVSEDREACYLVTVPRRSEVHFEQDGRELHCRPGGFIFERGDAPYRFHYACDNDLWVFKLPERALHGELRGAERYTRFCFDAKRGVGRIFVDQLAMCAARFDECDNTARHMLLEQALSTLLMALRNDERVLNSESSNLAALHLQRIEHYVEQQLGNPDLAPQLIADACGLSVRYLHKLFATTPYSLGEWIRLRRLEAVNRVLHEPNCHLSIGELAMRWGFSDQTQFARSFRQHFGFTAREARAGAVRSASQSG
ncbi:helix-turn-helix domain-containing protein [Pseudomonas sp. R5(2019)]|uniref:AraC-like ligand-binding domain-containing protein n=1 Tax=Pseudomonas sp. R5(2019) TaxID=2697566 RepID=UPI00141279A6|nr:helix-turn-helix domain-containing protein [Pseudomonas sp. R5(2019)]NBA93604.1 helix-turn-helix domain-containing protein [Pseudomonas sp. R5(2019)]